jgi:Tol biopolymer transport system component
MNSLRNKLLAVAALGAVIALYLVLRGPSGPPAGSGSGSGESASPAGPRPLLVSSTKGDSMHLHLFSVTLPSTLEPIGQGKGTEFDAAWSPDGRRIVFSSFMSEPGTPPAAQITTMAPDGSDRKPLTPVEPGVVATSPKWSPDGKSIAYSSVKFQDGQQPTLALNVMDKDGTNLHKVAEGVLPDWAPDGKTIAFTTFDFSQTFAPGLRVLDVAAGTSKELTKGENAMMPAYSPDGKSIAFVSDGGIGALPDIYVMNADGTGKRRLTTTDSDFETGPRWSLDGNTLYYARLSNEEVPHASLQSIPAAGGQSARLTEEGFTTIPGNGAGFLMVMLTGQGRTLFEAKQP